MERLKFFATTVIGLEDIAAMEVERLIGSKAEQDVGRILFEGQVSDIYMLNLKARTINKLFILLYRSNFESLDEIYKIARNLDYTWMIDPQQSFAVRTERIGVHDFTSMDVSKVIGQAIIDSYMNAAGQKVKGRI
jgi:tRNA (guanine6-N2)-methyltransferase